MSELIYQVDPVPFYVDYSKLHGRGMFTRDTLEPGLLFLIPCRIVYKEGTHTLFAGEDMYELFKPYRYLNHSDTPNAAVWFNGDDLLLEVIRKASRGYEITINYAGDD